MGTPRKKQLRVAGLDLAAVNSGLALIETSTQAGYPPVKWTLLKEVATKGGMSFQPRLEAAKVIVSTIKDFSVDLVALEDYALRMAKNNTSGYQYAEFAGIVKYRLLELGLPILLIPPTTMRSFLEIPKGSTKAAIMDAVYERYGFTSKMTRKNERSNVCDAFAHAYIGSCSYFAREGHLTGHLKKSEKKVIYGDGKKRLALIESEVMKKEPNG